MEKPRISPKILETLELSDKEKKVFEALLIWQWGQDVAKIAREARVARTTTLFILKKFERRKLAEKYIRINGRRVMWRYKRELESFKKSSFH